MSSGVTSTSAAMRGELPERRLVDRVDLHRILRRLHEQALGERLRGADELVLLRGLL